MFILLRNNVRRVLEGAVLAAGPGLMRVAVRGIGDILELRLINNLWVSDQDEYYEVDAITGSQESMTRFGNLLRVRTLTAGMPLV